MQSEIASNLISNSEDSLQLSLSAEEVRILLRLLRQADEFPLENEILKQVEDQSDTISIDKTPMTYTDFSLEKIKAIFDLKIISAKLFEDIEIIQPSELIQTILERNKKLPIRSEKSRSEWIVSPILTELTVLKPNRFTIFSGERFDVDEKKGLTGECDFLLSLAPEEQVIAAPVFALVEAKKQDLDRGAGQCAAQMIAAREFNQQKGKKLPCIYGCVTTGRDWQFLKLEENNLILDEAPYYEKLELDKILSILGYIVDFYGESEQSS